MASDSFRDTVCCRRFFLLYRSGNPDRRDPAAHRIPEHHLRSADPCHQDRRSNVISDQPSSCRTGCPPPHRQATSPRADGNRDRDHPLWHQYACTSAPPRPFRDGRLCPAPTSAHHHHGINGADFGRHHPKIKWYVNAFSIARLPRARRPTHRSCACVPHRADMRPYPLLPWD